MPYKCSFDCETVLNKRWPIFSIQSNHHLHCSATRIVSLSICEKEMFILICYSLEAQEPKIPSEAPDDGKFCLASIPYPIQFSTLQSLKLSCVPITSDEILFSKPSITYTEQQFLACGSWPLVGSIDPFTGVTQDYQKTQIVTLRFMAKLHLGSSSENNFITWRTVLECYSIRKIGKHSSWTLILVL